jgi:hypothetical protein
MKYLNKLLLTCFILISSLIFTGCFENDITGEWVFKNYNNPEDKRVIEFYKDNTLVISQGTKARNRHNGTWLKLDDNKVKITIETMLKDKTYTIDIINNTGFELGNFGYCRKSASTQDTADYNSIHTKCYGSF